MRTAECGCALTGQGAFWHDTTTAWALKITGTRAELDAVTATCLGGLGARVEHVLLEPGAATVALPTVPLRVVLTMAARMADTGTGAIGDLTYEQALALVVSHLEHLADVGDLAHESVRKIAIDVAAMTRYLVRRSPSPMLGTVTTALVAAWIDSPIGGRRRKGAKPAAATRRARRCSARQYFRVLRVLGLFDGDPTIDLRLPARGASALRPLDDTELDHCRLACLDLFDTRLPAVLALAEATATSGELPGILIRHCDLERGRVWIPGSTRRQPRWGYLTVWGVRALAARIAALREAGAGDDTAVVYEGSARRETSQSPQASASAAMREILDQAGLRGVPGVRPESLSIAFGARVWQRTGDLMLASRALGIRDLNRTAELVGALPADASDDEDVLARCVRTAAAGESVVVVIGRGGKSPRRAAGRGRDDLLGAANGVNPR